MPQTSQPIIDPVRFQWTAPRPTATPHRCPVCEGRGTVDSGFYTGGSATNTEPIKCRSCTGNGILWAW